VEKLTYYARWAAFLPSAVAAAWLAYVVAQLLYALSTPHAASDADPEWYATLIREGSSNGLMGTAFVYVGAIVAPKHRFTVAATFFGMALTAALLVAYTCIARGEYWPTVIRYPAIIVGSLIGLLLSKKAVNE
jgi:hypothetical protein